jgi:multiple antibiotic resistance protein
MSAVANSFLLVYAGLFPIVNPIGGAPIFLALTNGHNHQMRGALAGRVALNGFVLLLGSLFVGSHVLAFFGITLPVVRVAGGLAASFGWRLLRDGATAADDPTEQDGRGVLPIDHPLTVGPGSIAVAIALGATRPSEASGF